MINKAIFYTSIRPMFGGNLTRDQVDGMDRVLDEWERRKLQDTRWLSYMLATDKLETAATMQPIREMGGEAYLKRKKYYPWVGEGLVQVTWETNHRKFGATAPGQLLTWPKALNPLFDGMIKGMFTGKKLSDYFNAGVTDWNGARRIINGTDRADEIATMAKQFHAGILLATQLAPVVVDGKIVAPTAPVPTVPPPEPAATPMVKSKINWGATLAGVGGGLTAVQGAVQYATTQVNVVKATAAQASELVGQYSWVTSLFTSPLLLVGLGIVIIGAGAYVVWNRKQLAEEKGV